MPLKGFELALQALDKCEVSPNEGESRRYILFLFFYLQKNKQTFIIFLSLFEKLIFSKTRNVNNIEIILAFFF